jgi:parallel beta-helix repeat protein
VKHPRFFLTSYYFPASLTAVNITLVNNQALFQGGGIWAEYFCTVTLTNSNISANSASEGAGIYLSDTSECSLVNTTISDNVGASLSAQPDSWWKNPLQGAAH